MRFFWDYILPLSVVIGIALVILFVPADPDDDPPNGADW